MPREADHKVVRAEMDKRETPGISRTSIRSSAMALRMGVGISPWSDSVKIDMSAGVTMPMTAARSARKGTADITMKKDAWAA